jgi:hypothetical protein
MCEGEEGKTYVVIKLCQQMKTTVSNRFQNITNIRITLFIPSRLVPLSLHLNRSGPSIVTGASPKIIPETALVGDFALLTAVTGPLTVAFLLPSMALCTGGA